MAPHLFSVQGRKAPALHLLGLVGALLGGAFALAAVAGGGPALLVLGLVSLTLGLTSIAGASAMQRTVDTEIVGWRGPGPVLLFFVTLLWAMLTGALLGVLLGATDPNGKLDASLTTLLYVLATNLSSTAVIALLVVGTGAARWGDLFGAPAEEVTGHSALPSPMRAGGTLGDLLWGLALVAPSLVIALGVASVLTEQSGIVPNSPIAPAVPGTLGIELQIAISALAAAVIAPIGEELLYRGVLARAWGRQSGERRAVVFSTIIFAFAHTIGVGGESAGEALGAAAIAFSVRIPLGVSAGWLWVRRRSLIGPMVLHGAYNLAIVLLANG